VLGVIEVDNYMWFKGYWSYKDYFRYVLGDSDYIGDMYKVLKVTWVVGHALGIMVDSCICFRYSVYKG